MTLLEQAESLMQVGQFSEAENLLQQIITEDPSDMQAICDLGIVYTETGKNEQAIKALMHYLETHEDNTSAWEALGCAYFRMKRHKRAQECFERALSITPDHPSSLRNMGVLRGVMGYQDEGYQLVLRSNELKNDDFRTLYALSYIHKEFGEREKARKAMETLLTLSIPEDIHRDTVVNLIKYDLNWD